jgi:hypothetical protein
MGRLSTFARTFNFLAEVDSAPHAGLYRFFFRLAAFAGREK